MDFSLYFSAVALVTTMASLSSALAASSTASPSGKLARQCLGDVVGGDLGGAHC